MTTKLVNVRMPENLYHEGKEAVEEGGYANFQELIKDAVRHQIKEIKKDQALINLEKSFGSTKGKKKKPFTPKIKNRIAEEHTEKRAKELFKRIS